MTFLLSSVVFINPDAYVDLRAETPIKVLRSFEIKRIRINSSLSDLPRFTEIPNQKKL